MTVVIAAFRSLDVWLQPTFLELLFAVTPQNKACVLHVLAAALAATGATCQILDGDVVRQETVFFPRQDYPRSAVLRGRPPRKQPARVSPLPSDTATWAIAALISQYRHDRELARQAVGESRFFGVYLATSLTVCEARDPKGLYRRARAADRDSAAPRTDR